MQWSHDIIVYSKVNYISQNLHAAGVGITLPPGGGPCSSRSLLSQQLTNVINVLTMQHVQIYIHISLMLHSMHALVLT